MEGRKDKERRASIDARGGIAYTDDSVAAQLSRSSLPSSFSESEQAKGRLETGPAISASEEKSHDRSELQARARAGNSSRERIEGS
jgi:hypothetical protein